jgi:hypothetical protein
MLQSGSVEDGHADTDDVVCSTVAPQLVAPALRLFV